MKYNKIVRFYKDRPCTRVKIKHKFGAINKKNKEVIPVMFDWVSVHNTGIHVRLDGKFWDFDFDGILVKGKKDVLIKLVFENENK
jgi:hypothetical protein